MATNNIFPYSKSITTTYVNADSTLASSGFTSGSPIMIGKAPGVLLTDASTAKEITIALDGVWSLTVFNPTSNQALANGNPVFWNSTARRIHVGSTLAGHTSGNPVFGRIWGSIAAASTGNSTGQRIEIGGFHPT